jgi:hypothetical protein
MLVLKPPAMLLRITQRLGPLVRFDGSDPDGGISFMRFISLVAPRPAENAAVVHATVAFADVDDAKSVAKR